MRHANMYIPLICNYEFIIILHTIDGYSLHSFSFISIVPFPIYIPFLVYMIYMISTYNVWLLAVASDPLPSATKTTG